MKKHPHTVVTFERRYSFTYGVKEDHYKVSWMGRVISAKIQEAGALTGRIVYPGEKVVVDLCSHQVYSPDARAMIEAGFYTIERVHSFIEQPLQKGLFE